MRKEDDLAIDAAVALPEAVLGVVSSIVAQILRDDAFGGEGRFDQSFARSM